MMKIKTVVLPVMAVLLFFCQSDRNNIKGNHYLVRLRLDPAIRFMNVRLDMNLELKQPLPDTLIFSLHRQFTLKNVTGGAVRDFYFDFDGQPPSIYMPEARSLFFTLDKNSIKNNRIKLSMEYEGSVTEWPEYSANVVTEDWVELGLYLPWFPLSWNYGLFTYELEVECPPAYQVRSFGKHKFRNGKWLFKQDTPTFDMVLFASKNLRTMQRESGSNTVFVHYETLGDSTAEKFADDLFRVVSLYGNLFGGDLKEETITLVESPREMGGGYYRRGLIAMTWLSDEKYVTEHEDIFRFLAHETGHLWWSRASAESWEDWLNEGFAEYSALLAVKDVFGENAFMKRIGDKKETLPGTPPIWGFDRSDMTSSGQSQAVEVNLYNKGTVLLYRLSERIGSGEFNKLCREMVLLPTLTTADMLKLLEKNYGAGISGWFEGLLKTF